MPDNMVLRTLGWPLRVAFRQVLRLGSTELCPETGSIAEVPALNCCAGQAALIVGGTRGIGRAVARALGKLGADVSVVGRSASNVSAPFEALAADLSTIDGCKRLVEALRGRSFTIVVFTVGAWPDFNDPLTVDGIEKVVALDLVARHVVLTGLQREGCLATGCRVMNVLASCQSVPFETTASVKARVTGERPSSGMFSALAPVGIAADAWLQAAAARLPGELHFVGMFPGIVVTDLPACTFPPWAVCLMQLAMSPIASSEEETGDAHASVINSPNVGGRRISYFTNLLEGRKAHPLAYDTQLQDWLWGWLEQVVGAA